MGTPFNPVADLTDRQKAPGEGMDMRLMFTACGHKGQRTGATFKRGVPWRCPTCVAARPEKVGAR